MLQQSLLEQNLVILKKHWRDATSGCHFFIYSPGGNFTYASWCLSLCYCFSYIIVPPTRCHSNWRRKRKDRGEGKKKQFQSLQKKRKRKEKPVGITSPPSSSASVSVFIYFFQSAFQKKAGESADCISTDHEHNAFILRRILKKPALCRAIFLNRKHKFKYV